MARVILHIGTHKTATTTIQDMFAHNARLLARNGLIYPRIGDIAGHHGLVGDWNVQLPDIYRYPTGSRGALREVARNYADASGTVFLSTEELSRAVRDKRSDLSEIREILGDFESIQVICTLREQWQFVQSVYVEIAKHRVPPPLHQMVNGSMMHDMIDGLWCDYNRLYDDLLESFEPSEIMFLDFATAVASEGGIVGAMLRAVGCPLRADELAVVHGGESNTSPPPLAMYVAAAISEPQAGHSGLVATVHALLQQRYGRVPTTLLSHENLAKLKLHFGRRNAQFHERIKAVQPGFAITQSDPKPGTVLRDDLDDAFWAECRALVDQASKS